MNWVFFVYCGMLLIYLVFLVVILIMNISSIRDAKRINNDQDNW